MLTSDFLTFLVLSPNFHGGAKTHFASSADTHESSLEKQNVLEKISSGLTTLAETH